MFWKKKQNNTEIILSDEIQNQRYAFRFKSGEANQLDFIFLGHRVKSIDISASGVSFENKGFSVGDSDHVELALKNSDLQDFQTISVTIKILMIDDKDVCHCCFENITEEQKEILHHYVLKQQKRAIRERRKRDTSY